MVRQNREISTTQPAAAERGKPLSMPLSNEEASGPARYNPEIPRRNVDIPSSARRMAQTRQAVAESKTLVVAREISIVGDITSCDKLVVEGRVEASLTDARVLEVTRTGSFKGNATVDEADISGRFEGTLIAQKKLTVRDGGRLSGAIRYESIVIESGGQISGDMQTLDQSAPADGNPRDGNPLDGRPLDGRPLEGHPGPSPLRRPDTPTN